MASVLTMGTSKDTPIWIARRALGTDAGAPAAAETPSASSRVEGTEPSRSDSSSLRAGMGSGVAGVRSCAASGVTPRRAPVAAP